MRRSSNAVPQLHADRYHFAAATITSNFSQFKICVVQRGATGGGAHVFHTLAKDKSLNRGATHFQLGLRSCIISSFLLYIPVPPSLKITYRVFIKYCVFSKILIYFPDSVFPRCQCVYTNQAGRTPALQHNWQS